VDGRDLPPGFYVPSTERIGPATDLRHVPKVSVQASKSSEHVARINNSLVPGYQRIEHEFQT